MSFNIGEISSFDIIIQINFWSQVNSLTIFKPILGGFTDGYEWKNSILFNWDWSSIRESDQLCVIFIRIIYFWT